VFDIDEQPSASLAHHVSAHEPLERACYDTHPIPLGQISVHDLYAFGFVPEQTPDGLDFFIPDRSRLAPETDKLHDALHLQHIEIFLQRNTDEDIVSKYGDVYPFFAVSPLATLAKQGKVGLDMSLLKPIKDALFRISPRVDDIPAT
jgi:hypothetical protein